MPACSQATRAGLARLAEALPPRAARHHDRVARALALLAILPAAIAAAGEATVRWEAPTSRVDGTPLGDALLGYRLRIFCDTEPVERVIEIPPQLREWFVDDLPDQGLCDFHMTALARGNVDNETEEDDVLESGASNRASKFLIPADPTSAPEVVSSETRRTWSFTETFTRPDGTQLIGEPWAPASETLPAWSGVVQAPVAPLRVFQNTLLGNTTPFPNMPINAGLLSIGSAGGPALPQSVRASARLAITGCASTGCLANLLLHVTQDERDLIRFDMRGDGQWFVRARVNGTERQLAAGDVGALASPGVMSVEASGGRVIARWKDTELANVAHTPRVPGAYVGVILRTGGSTGGTRLDDLVIETGGL